jgi:protein tyrosine phosphatase
MPRQPSPKPAPYLRLILGISVSKKILSVEEQSRLDLAVAMVKFVAKQSPRKEAMASFIQEYMREHNASRSYCYKIVAKLKELTIIKWDTYWQEYRLNMERWKRDLKALRQFKAQIQNWDRLQ